MLDKTADVRSTIRHTDYDNIDLIPANVNLIPVEKMILADTSTVQQFRLRNHIRKIENQYDFCILDCPPSLSIVCMNGLAMADDVIVPVLIDDFSFTGFTFIMEAIQDVSDFNDRISLCGSFVNLYKARTSVMRDGIETLEKNPDMKMFETHIRDNIAVKESTFAHQPICEYKKSANAAQDYLRLVGEYNDASMDAGKTTTISLTSRQLYTLRE